MDEFKGTPGPYKVIYGGYVSDDGFAIGSDNAAASRVKLICECWPPTIIDDEHRRELAANARLLASSFEMLELLDRFTDCQIGGCRAWDESKLADLFYDVKRLLADVIHGKDRP